MRTHEFLLAARLEAPALAAWIEAGWLLPRRDADAHNFSEADLARAQLIRDLQHDMGVNEEAVPIILDLLDQLHGLRQALRDRPHPGSADRAASVRQRCEVERRGVAGGVTRGGRARTKASLCWVTLGWLDGECHVVAMSPQGA
jgi:chaperone modulatory protein CbpM